MLSNFLGIELIVKRDEKFDMFSTKKKKFEGRLCDSKEGKALHSFWFGYFLSISRPGTFRFLEKECIQFQ